MAQSASCLVNDVFGTASKSEALCHTDSTTWDDEKGKTNMPTILGICGSPREGATAYALREALKAAETVPGITTTFWSVRGKKIANCIHCNKCVRDKEMCFQHDDFDELADLMLKADGYLIASPVYDMGITAQLTACINRTRPMYIVHPGSFKNKVGGAIALGGTRNGGEETAIITLHNFYLMHEVLVCGGLSGCYSGGKVWTQDKKAEGAAADEVGMATVRGTAIAVAQAAAVMAMGREQWKREHGDADGEVRVVQDHALFE